MCLAIPGRIVEIKDEYAEVDYGGVYKHASVRLFKDAKVGDYVLVHAGFVIQILDKDDGEELEKLIEETMGFITRAKISPTSKVAGKGYYHRRGHIPRLEFHRLGTRSKSLIPIAGEVDTNAYEI